MIQLELRCGHVAIVQGTKDGEEWAIAPIDTCPICGVPQSVADLKAVKRPGEDWETFQGG